MKFPNLSNLTLLGDTNPRRAPVSSPPPPCVDYNRPGILASAVTEWDQDALQTLIEINKPTRFWYDDAGFGFAYYSTEAATDYVVARCHQYHIKFALLGDYSVDPRTYLLAVIDIFGNESDLKGRGSSINIFSTEEEARKVYEKIWSDKGMSHLQKDYESVDNMLDALRRGKRLRIMWSDDGMDFVREYLEEVGT